MAKKSNRKLSEIEIAYIRDHTDISIADLINSIPDVDGNEIESLYNHYKTKNVKDTQSVTQIHDPNAHVTGNLMAKRDGVVIQTQASTELADVRKAFHVQSNPQFASTNKDKIHVINPNKKK